MPGRTPEPAAPGHFLLCPLCEGGLLKPFGGRSVRCEACGQVLGGPPLETLRGIAELPEAVGRHPCECGHPEMRLLPGGPYRCPACGDEVSPAGEPPPFWMLQDQSEAYRCGWLDGRYLQGSSFTTNGGLARWTSPEDRLDYYRGHRDGRNARLAAGEEDYGLRPDAPAA
ncbi:hypothetical protein Rxycam_00303 [Rubrobacter xylanophilus DSM 9941]|uniref:hypothetical protein n=1 Tax=Rubrobacter xylanophilus TaxID=49319 RepID=UPI001C642C6D|nr:hypothetical protein [Rubrobacter xylanophilus]QYJ14507.1 hypothetical protein Rxycam_00303 [Rubrobacter xylanophilus DSM 9941]